MFGSQLPLSTDNHQHQSTYQNKLASFLQDDLTFERYSSQTDQPSTIDIQDDIKPISKYILNQVKIVLKPEQELIRCLQCILQLFYGLEPWIPKQIKTLTWSQLQKLLTSKLRQLMVTYKQNEDRVPHENIKLARQILGYKRQVKKNSPRNSASSVFINAAYRLMEYFETKHKVGCDDINDINALMKDRMISPINPLLDQSDHLDITWPFPQNYTRQPSTHKKETIEVDRKPKKIQARSFQKSQERVTPKIQPQKSQEKERLSFRQDSKLIRNLNLDVTRPSTSKNQSPSSQVKNTRSKSIGNHLISRPASNTNKTQSNIPASIHGSFRSKTNFSPPTSKTALSRIPENVTQEKYYSKQLSTQNNTKRQSFNTEPILIDQAILQCRKQIERLLEQKSQLRAKIQLESKLIQELEVTEKPLVTGQKRVQTSEHTSPKNILTSKSTSPSQRARAFLFK